MKRMLISVALIGALFLTPYNPIKGIRNFKIMMNLKSQIESYGDVTAITNNIQQSFESQRSPGTPALYEPETAVRTISGIAGVTVQSVSALEVDSNTIKNNGEYTSGAVDALQFVITSDNCKGFLQELDKLQYITEVVKWSPATNTVIVNINFGGEK